MADYIIVGGGLAGVVLASRLKQQQPTLKITLIEAGTDESTNPLVTEPAGTFKLPNSPLVYKYWTTPQKHYDGRQVYNSGGKMISGSSGCNYAMWTRGDAADYNVWGELVNDKRWSYEGQLPYLKKSEHHFDPTANPDVHGFDGPIYTTPIDRAYPLKSVVRAAYERLGLRANADINCGDITGYGPYVENWKGGKRQPAARSYSLHGVDIITAAPVRRVTFGNANEMPAATGVELLDGRLFTASKEVILSCGAIRTPQVLMLSGIGPAQELAKHSIPLIQDHPHVGQNLFDHIASSQFYRLRHPEEGLCMGSPAFHARDPAYSEGMPMDWLCFSQIPHKDLKSALEKDNEPPTHPLLTRPRNPIEHLVSYACMEQPGDALGLPQDGSIITTGSLNMLPTSRGSITLSSADPEAHPLIDPNYFATETDKLITRTAMRTSMAVMETPEMAKYIAGEVPPAGFPALSTASTDEEIDARIRRTAGAWYHPAGSCAMGKVVDTDLRVMGIKGLRVVDASVYPTPLAAHLQAPTYALAEQAAEIIARG